MKNVSHGTIQKNIKEVDKMEKNKERLSNELTDFILTNDFLTRFIVDNVKEKIYNNQSYDITMIESLLINDTETSGGGYILGFIAEEIDVYQIAFRIHDKYGKDFYKWARDWKR